MRARERAPIDAQGEFRVAQGGPNRGDSARRERTLSLEQRVAEILERVRIMEERGNLPPDYESRE
ncbi:hypothetical protein BDP27DRAFT_1340186 [Rhodocollybia butyracea]|uniref:Uncharacterized protein n=1 Tax=Rhodocollybia butyracea TaxID=206335 RepID=A0A9P5TZ93_9AGAR|nr:hypothetical protein BDP27DRAFT_1340186 [Rhodocollybia butyracea]